MKLKLLAGERRSGESDRAVQGCNDWLRMGPGRSLTVLLSRYTSSNQDSPPTLSEGTLKQWSSRFDWQNRAAVFDAQWEQYKNEERQRVFERELALDYERVDKLNRLGQFLEGQLYEQGEDGNYHNLWLPDVKVVGYGEFSEVVDIERFNAPLVRELRETLNDLAAETGGRVKNQNIKIEDWKLDVVNKLQSGDLTPAEVRAVWPDLAAEFFAKAGIRNETNN
jgi:hypothetical protein